MNVIVCINFKMADCFTCLSSLCGGAGKRLPGGEGENGRSHPPVAAVKSAVKAAKLGDVDALLSLINTHGHDVCDAGDPDFFNYTPLHAAAGAGKDAVVQFLLERTNGVGSTATRVIRVDPKSSTEETPLLMAARGKHRACSELLLAAGADRGAHTNYNKKTAGNWVEEMGI